MSIQLANGSKALAAIVVPKEPTEQEQYAANELCHYLSLMTSAAFEVTTEPCEGACIAIATDAELSEDGFSIETTDSGAVILGGKRGVIYGVYELLERLGCRFFTPTCEKVPCQPELQLPDIHTHQVPALEYRDHGYCDFVQNGRFAVKCRLNGHFPQIKEKFGGHMPYTGYVHTLGSIVPVELFGESHPEYFALYDGKRCLIPHRTQLCLTNPDVVKVATERVRQMLREHPDTRIISISQNDVGTGCQCEKCLASDREEGSPAGTLLRFVNAIAEALEEEFPQVIFDTLAYQYTRPVPRITKPRHNVCVRLCSIECCFSHPFETCDDDRGVTLPDGTRSSFVRDLKQWGEYHDRLYIWDYTTCFAHYPAPFPNWRILQPNMQLFVRNHAKGVYEQSNGAKKGGVDFNELRAYLIAKLLWDADCDVQKHMEEFTDYYYGAAGVHVRRYINALCDKAERDNIHVGYNDQTDGKLYTPELLNELDSIMDEAENAVQGDALRMWRIGKARLSVRWVRMKNKSMVDGKLDPQEVNAFFTDWRAYGLSRIEEWVGVELTHKALLQGKWQGVQFLEHFSQGGEEEF